MKYYQDITLLPDTEISPGFIWQKVYQQIHIALADNKIAENQSAIAVAFPEYGRKGFPLGKKLQLLAETQEQLEQLNLDRWLERLRDYCHIRTIKEVPLEIAKFACFKRKQFKSNLLKEARRRAKYKGETINQSLTHFQHYKSTCKLPYINMSSLSMSENKETSRNFKLFIEREVFDKPQEGTFNCYGLSKTATVPLF